MKNVSVNSYINKLKEMESKGSDLDSICSSNLLNLLELDEKELFELELSLDILMVNNNDKFTETLKICLTKAIEFREFLRTTTARDLRNSVEKNKIVDDVFNNNRHWSDKLPTEEKEKLEDFYAKFDNIDKDIDLTKEVVVDKMLDKYSSELDNLSNIINPRRQHTLLGACPVDILSELGPGSYISVESTKVSGKFYVVSIYNNTFTLIPLELKDFTKNEVHINNLIYYSFKDGDRVCPVLMTTGDSYKYHLRKDIVTLFGRYITFKSDICVIDNVTGNSMFLDRSVLEEQEFKDIISNLHTVDITINYLDSECVNTNLVMKLNSMVTSEYTDRDFRINEILEILNSLELYHIKDMVKDFLDMDTNDASYTENKYLDLLEYYNIKSSVKYNSSWFNFLSVLNIDFQDLQIQEARALDDSVYNILSSYLLSINDIMASNNVSLSKEKDSDALVTEFEYYSKEYASSNGKIDNDKFNISTSINTDSNCCGVDSSINLTKNLVYSSLISYINFYIDSYTFECSHSHLISNIVDKLSIIISGRDFSKTIEDTLTTKIDNLGVEFNLEDIPTLNFIELESEIKNVPCVDYSFNVKFSLAKAIRDNTVLETNYIATMCEDSNYIFIKSSQGTIGKISKSNRNKLFDTLSLVKTNLPILVYNKRLYDNMKSYYYKKKKDVLVVDISEYLRSVLGVNNYSVSSSYHLFRVSSKVVLFKRF